MQIFIAASKKCAMQIRAMRNQPRDDCTHLLILGSTVTKLGTLASFQFTKWIILKKQLKMVLFVKFVKNVFHPKSTKRDISKLSMRKILNAMCVAKVLEVAMH